MKTTYRIDWRTLTVWKTTMLEPTYGNGWTSYGGTTEPVFSLLRPFGAKAHIGTTTCSKGTSFLI